MFDSLTSNEIGLIASVYFLLRTIFGEKTLSKDFVSCFPARSNTQRREFKAKTRKWFEKIQADGLVPIGLLKPTSMNMAKGKSAQSLVYMLTHVAMKKQIQRFEKKFDGQQNGTIELPDMINDVTGPPNVQDTWQPRTEKLCQICQEQEHFLQQLCDRFNAEAIAEDEFYEQCKQQQTTLWEERNTLEQSILALENDSSKSEAAASSSASETREFVNNLAPHASLSVLDDGLARLNSKSDDASTISLPPGSHLLPEYIQENVQPKVEHLHKTAKATNAIDMQRLEKCLQQIELVRHQVDELQKKLGKGLEELNQVRASHSDVLLRMR